MKQLAIQGGVPVRSEFLPYGHQWIDGEDINAVAEVLKTDWITQGPKIEEFEGKVAEYYVIQLRLEELKVGRREVFGALRAKNIGVNVHYIPVHLQPFYRRKFGCQKGDYPRAEGYYDRAITLPIFPKMSEEDVRDVIEAVRKVMDFYGND